MGYQMRKIMQAAGQSVPDSLPVLEINREHPLIAKLGAEEADERFGELAEIIFDQATLAVGQPLQDPAAYVDRINRLLLELA
jgi:molecular chaperone HtpG